MVGHAMLEDEYQVFWKFRYRRCFCSVVVGVSIAIACVTSLQLTLELVSPSFCLLKSRAKFNIWQLK